MSIPSFVPKNLRGRIREMYIADDTAEEESWVIWLKRPWVFDEDDWGNSYVSDGRAEAIEMLKNAYKVDDAI